MKHARRHVLIAAGLGLAFIAPAPVHAAGPDVTYQEAPSIGSTGASNGFRGYSLGSHTCNLGNQVLQWQGNGTPGLAMNGYRLHNGRLEQIGQGWVKTACCAASTPGCGTCLGGGGGLGAGCRDTYDAGWNAIQSRLSPRSKINPFTGSFAGPIGTSGTISGHLQIAEADMNSTNFPGALYFVEGLYISSDDAQAGNQYNNASYKRVTISPTFGMTGQGTMLMGTPAIQAWRDHGLGLNTPDPSVNINNANVPGEGRFIIASKAKDNQDGTWRYEYAIYNFNSDRAGGSFSVPVPKGATITNIGFKDVNYHSGEPYANTDWVAVRAAGQVIWSSPQTFGENANTNALRWGTMYNFWFDADKAPATVDASIGLFKPGTPGSVLTPVPAPGSPCDADVNGDSTVNVDDLLAVIAAWGDKGGPADITANGIVNVDDLLTLLNSWGSCS